MESDLLGQRRSNIPPDLRAFGKSHQVNAMIGDSCRKSGRLVVVIGLVIFAAGCRSASPRTAQVGVLHDPNDIKVNREQLRLRVRSLVGPMMGRMG